EALATEFPRRPPHRHHQDLIRLPWDAIVTTNYDCLLEDACREREVEYILITFRRNLGIEPPGRLPIIKLHGGLDDYRSLVLDADSYDQYKRRHRLAKIKVEDRLAKRPLVFFGCSMKDPRLLEWLRQRRKERKPPLEESFAVLTKGDWNDIDEQDRDTIKKANISPLFSRDHNVIPTLINKLYHDVPDPARTAASATSIWNVPYKVNRCLPGREQLLQEVETYFTTRYEGLTVQALVGENGLGKTQVGLVYASKRREAYRAVFWIRATSEAQTANSLAEIARVAIPHHKDTRKFGILKTAVKEWLKAHPNNWLVVLDDLHPGVNLDGLLREDAKGHVLITAAADSECLRSWAEVRLVPPLAPDDAEQVLLAHVGSSFAHGERWGWAEVARHLGCVPLALALAGSYIRVANVDPQEYLARLDAQASADHAEEESGNTLRILRAVVTLSLRHLESISPPASDLLRMSAFLCPNLIPLMLASRGATEVISALPRSSKMILARRKSSMP
ncbi:MAG: SIR2 family protein, partial [Bacteroidota bacterium]